jgi:Fic family protein
MQVVSGRVGRERVHFEAPAAAILDREIAMFLDWFEGAAEKDWVVKAAIAHLWFATIHPFDDGNGRIARAIADPALARSEESPQRFYSMSAQIRTERTTYYEILERTQKATPDITPWMVVSPVPRTRHRRRAEAGAEPPPQRLRRKADYLEVGRACEMLTRYGAA